jgi:hypothetical protein
LIRRQHFIPQLMLQPNDGVSFRLVPVFQMFQLLLQLFVRFSLPFGRDEVEPDRHHRPVQNFRSESVEEDADDDDHRRLFCASLRDELFFPENVTLGKRIKKIKI